MTGSFIPDPLSASLKGVCKKGMLLVLDAFSLLTVQKVGELIIERRHDSSPSLAPLCRHRQWGLFFTSVYNSDENRRKTKEIQREFWLQITIFLSRTPRCWTTEKSARLLWYLLIAMPTRNFQKLFDRVQGGRQGLWSFYESWERSENSSPHRWPYMGIWNARRIKLSPRLVTVCFELYTYLL